jgi:maleate isomerase
MAAATHARIGFITPSGPASPHFAPFRALVPPDVELDFEGLGLLRESLDDLEDRAEAVLKAAKLADERGWQGLIVSGAPLELLNPNLSDRLRAAVRIPVTTALTACVAALQALGARRVLLITPFDEPMNQKIREHLADRQVTATSPSGAFDEIDEARKLSPDEVYRFATTALETVKDVDAIYFQGAVLDPLHVMDRLEGDLGRPVVASNPAMLWFILSQLGLTYHIDGYGKLLRDWPTPKTA